MSIAANRRIAELEQQVADLLARIEKLERKRNKAA